MFKGLNIVVDTYLVMLSSHLPLDIIRHIFSYTGSIKLRNGKYMGQISKSDKRYELLLKIPREIDKIFDVTSTNYGYFVKVNGFLTIRIFYIRILSRSRPLEYDYKFKGRKAICYFPR